jgi:hypothetical protein
MDALAWPGMMAKVLHLGNTSRRQRPLRGDLV